MSPRLEISSNDYYEVYHIIHVSGIKLIWNIGFQIQLHIKFKLMKCQK